MVATMKVFTAYNEEINQENPGFSTSTSTYLLGEFKYWKYNVTDKLIISLNTMISTEKCTEVFKS